MHVAPDRLALVAVGRQRDRHAAAQERPQRGGGRAAPALGDLDLLAGARGLGGELLEPARRAGRPRSARSSGRMLTKCAITTRCGRSSARARRGQDRVDHLLGARSPAAIRSRTSRGCVGPSAQRHLVVGGVDRVDAVDAVRAGRARRWCRAASPRSRSAAAPRSRARSRCDRLDVARHPVGVGAHVVDAAERDQPERLGTRRCCPRCGRGRRRTSSARACPASAFTTRSPPRGAAGPRCRRTRRSAPGRSAPSRCPRTASGPSGIGVPSASPIASRGMSTPAAMVSGIVPGKRALTSSSAGSPSASTLTCTLATVVSPISVGDLAREASRAPRRAACGR